MCALTHLDDSTLQPAMTALVQAWSQYPMCCPVTGDALIRLTVHWIATAPFHPDHTSAMPKRTAIAVTFFKSIRRFRTANTAVDATDIDPHAAVAITTLFTMVLDAEALPAPTPSLCFVVDALPPSVLGFSCGFLRRVVRQLTDAQAAICLGRILQWPLTNSIGMWHVCMPESERGVGVSHEVTDYTLPGPWVMGVVSAMCGARKYRAVVQACRSSLRFGTV